MGFLGSFSFWFRISFYCYYLNCSEMSELSDSELAVSHWTWVPLGENERSRGLRSCPARTQEPGAPSVPRFLAAECGTQSPTGSTHGNIHRAAALSRSLFSQTLLPRPCLSTAGALQQEAMLGSEKGADRAAGSGAGHRRWPVLYPDVQLSFACLQSNSHPTLVKVRVELDRPQRSRRQGPAGGTRPWSQERQSSGRRGRAASG